MAMNKEGIIDVEALLKTSAGRLVRNKAHPIKP
jgi:hypothetical protein